MTAIIWLKSSRFTRRMEAMDRRSPSKTRSNRRTAEVPFRSVETKSVPVVNHLNPEAFPRDPEKHSLWIILVVHPKVKD